MDINFKNNNIKFNCRVAIIIECDNKFLFQQTKNDTNYTLVGGRLTLMEASIDGAVRELKEELGYSANKNDLKLAEITENFYDYYDEDNKLQFVHSILFIYKIKISNDEEFTKKNGFSVLDKLSTKLYWLDKESAINSSILPKIGKRLINESDFKYHINDDTRYK